MKVVIVSCEFPRISWYVGLEGRIFDVTTDLYYTGKYFVSVGNGKRKSIRKSDALVVGSVEYIIWETKLRLSAFLNDFVRGLKIMLGGNNE